MMTTEEVVRLVFSFLGGGLVSGILNWIKAARSEKTSRRMTLLNEQIRNLYGPLYFFTTQNEKCFALNDSILKAYRKEYTEEEYSKDEYTQENLRKKTTLTLDIVNSYVGLVTLNNEKIIDIIRDNYSYIDPEDVDLFQQFIVDYNRMKTERDESGKLITPIEIYEHVGEISFMRPNFIERIKSKFTAKKNEIETESR